jgi:hypothetical protein
LDHVCKGKEITRVGILLSTYLVDRSMCDVT